MNLFDMAQRQDDALIITPSTKMAKWSTAQGETWRSLRICQEDMPQVSIDQVAMWYPFTTRPETVGWYARTLRDKASVLIQLKKPDGTVVGATQINIDENPRFVPIPWPLSAHQIDQDVLLTLHFNLSKKQAADLMINRCLERDELISLARGTGVEIGPGPKPQIKNGNGVNVKYVEEMSAGEWKDLYDKGGQYQSDSADWSHHIVGKASALPCDDASLDFIFSSHVFEHLANPIGHLEHWAAKLKPGGVILSVVPDIAGTKDFRHQPSLLDEMIQEYREEIWEPTHKHYHRWAQTRGSWKDRVEEAMAQKRSIHVHFYSRENTSTLLRYATENLPFSGYHIRHTPNHRDFYWVLIRQ